MTKLSAQYIDGVRLTACGAMARCCAQSRRDGGRAAHPSDFTGCPARDHDRSRRGGESFTGRGRDAETARATIGSFDPTPYCFDPTPYFVRYGDNPWAALKTYLDAASEVAAEPVVQKYIDVLGAVDVFTQSSAFTQSNAFTVLESIRLGDGVEVAVHD